MCTNAIHRHDAVQKVTPKANFISASLPVIIDYRNQELGQVTRRLLKMHC